MSASRTLRQTLIVCRKELRDSLRDRRALWSILFSVVIGPVLVGFMMNKLADRQRDADVVRIPVVGMGRAPALVNWLNQQGGVEVVEGPAEAEKAVREQREAVVVIVPDDFAERFRSSRPAPLQLVADSSRNDVRPSVQRVQLLLQQYAAEISSLRLIMRGVSPAAVRPLAIEEIEVSTAQQRAAQILTFIPMFIMVAGFVGGMQIATDSTAGERERGSLEPLLVNPAPRVAFVAGKWMAATLAAIVSVCLTTVLCAQITRLLSLEDMGIRLEIGPQHVGSDSARGRADVSVHYGTAGHGGHAREIVQRGADLYGRPHSRADAAGHHVRACIQSAKPHGTTPSRCSGPTFFSPTSLAEAPPTRPRFSRRQRPACSPARFSFESRPDCSGANTSFLDGESPGTRGPGSGARNRVRPR